MVKIIHILMVDQGCQLPDYKCKKVEYITLNENVAIHQVTFISRAG